MSALSDTLDNALASPAFVKHCLYPLLEAVQYSSSLVDERAVYQYARSSPETYERALGMASVLNAALQWFTHDAEATPEFVRTARRYLAKTIEPEKVELGIPPTPGNVNWYRTGVVAARKGGVGNEGRLQEVRRVRDLLVAKLSKLEPGQLYEELELYRRIRKGQSPQPLREGHPRGTIPQWLAQHLWIQFSQSSSLVTLVAGIGTDLDAETARIAYAVSRVLEEKGIPTGSTKGRASRLEDVAEALIREGLRALGAGVDKDLFRVRRR